MQLTRCSALATVALILVGGGLITGCTHTRIYPEGAADGVMNTDPLRVELIPWAPPKPHEVVGEIIIEPAGNATRSDIEKELQFAAADLGAHAIFIVWDPTHRLELVQVDPVATDHKTHYPPNGIVAVAIRYK